MDNAHLVDSKEFLELAEDVKAIKRALLGDEYHTQGMVHRLKECEATSERVSLQMQRIKWIILGALLAGAALGIGVNDLLQLLLAG